MLRALPLLTIAVIAFVAVLLSAAPAAAAVMLEVFVREDCPHCTEAKAWLVELERQRPDLLIIYREVDRDPAAREALVELSRQHGLWPPGVPSFVAGERMRVGFASAEHSGPAIVALIDAAASRDADTRTDVEDEPVVETALFGTLSARDLGLPLFTLALGLLDGFNPCAMWVLLFLLSLLVRLRDRRRMALIAGTFVLVSGAVYYAFMAAWLNVFLAVGLSQTVRALLALVALGIGLVNVKDYFAFGRGPTLSIPDAAKPGIYARVRGVLRADALTASLLGVAVLAVLVNFVELLCTAGFPAIYTAVLTQHALEPWQHYAYLGLYILGYIADDSLMVAIAVITLGSGRLTERGGRGLKLISGAVMLALGVVMLLRPDWLM